MKELQIDSQMKNLKEKAVVAISLEDFSKFYQGYGF
jgi:hypothetical protein